MTTSHHILYIWHINKNSIAHAINFFEEPDQVKAWMNKWYKVCQAPTLSEYQQAQGELRITDPICIVKYFDSLFKYIKQEYLVNGNNEKHCYYWTNRITHFNKNDTFTPDRGHANIKHALESTLGDLPKVVKVIREKIEDQLCKIHFQHTSVKNGNIKAMLNFGMFWYFRHEISKCALDLMATHIIRVNATIVLTQYIEIFSKTLSLPFRHQIQESFRNPSCSFQHNNLHLHWWLNPMEDKQLVEPWAKI